MKRQVKKFERKLNPDTATAEKIQHTNEELYKYLQEKGEKDAAKQVSYLMNNQATPEKEDPKKNPVYDKLLKTNNKILEVLSKIQRDMIDEQDTSIKPVSKAIKPTTSTTAGSSGVMSEAGESTEYAGGPGLLDAIDLLDGPDRRKEKKPGKTGKGQKPSGKTPPTPGGGGPGGGPDKKPSPKKTSKSATPKKPAKPRLRGKDGRFIKAGAQKASGKLGGKMAGKLAGKALGGALKFAGPVGLAITAGMALYDGYEGWNKAGENLGLEEGQEASITNKASSAAGEAVSGLTFGLVDASKASKGINNMFGGNDTIQKYEKAGIIEHHTIGDSTIKDWTALGQLEPKEIQKIIDIDDWRDEDLDRLKKIKEANETIASKKATEPVKVRTAADDIRSRLTPEQLKWLGDADPTDPVVMAKLKAAVPDKPNAGQRNNASEGTSQDKQPAGATSTSTSSTGGQSSAPAKKSEAGAGRGVVNPAPVNAVSGDDDIKEMIKRHEGVRNKPYKDSLGLWTVGVGHLIGNGRTLPMEYDRTFSDEEINTMFEEDYAAHKAAAEQIPGFMDLNKTGQGALTDLTFNMGGKWYKKWPKFTKNISEGNTEEAAKSLEDSKWYGQVGNRAPEVVAMIRAGAGPETEASATKNAGSGVDTKKASEANTAKTEKPTTVAEASDVKSDKTKKEVAVNQTSTNLKTQTVAYDTGTQTAALSATVVPVINQSINSSKPKENVGQDRLLNLFS